MRAMIVAGCVIAFLAVLTAFVVLTLSGKDTSTLVAFVGGASASVIPNIFTLLRTHSTAQTVSEVQADVSEVKERTNGPLTRLAGQVAEVASRIGAIESKMRE